MTQPFDQLPCAFHHVSGEILASFTLSSGKSLSQLAIAYTTLGTLNKARTNAILICHALTGDQYVGTSHPVTGKAGWWDRMVGPGKPLDTDRYFLICANVLGGCAGTTGPQSLHPDTQQPYRLDFPVITIADMVAVQKLLIDALGIDKLLAVVGGSMGGMQVLQWASSYPEQLHAAVTIASAARHSAQNIAFHELGRQAIMADPSWAGGQYESQPTKGLAVARMAAHITYLSEPALTRKFGRRLQARDSLTYGFDADFQVESYLRHQGMSFVDRFDANSYLYITRAMDYFDLAADHDGNLAAAFAQGQTRHLVISFDSDWLFTTAEAKHLVHALNAAGQETSFLEISSDKGHDAFLLEEPELDQALRGFLDATWDDVGGTP